MITCKEPLATDAAGILLEPGAPGWDAARRPFDPAVDQRPALVALPTDERQVAAAAPPLATVELRHAPGGFFTHASGTPTDAASSVAIEAQLALVAGALAD